MLFLLNITACSYSPNSLKEIYSELGSGIADQLKEPIDLSSSQATKIDNYANEMMKWHRKNKLPEYSQTFLRLAAYIQQENLPLPVLQSTLKKLNEMPHFEQARHLTPLMNDVAQSLTKSQISQLEQSFKDEYQKTKYEIKTKKLANVINEDTNLMFHFIGASLNSEQKKILKAESKKFHDLRWLELRNEKQWNDRFIALLRRANSPQFNQQFAQLWHLQTIKFQGKALQQKQQNDQREAKLIKTLIMKFNREKKSKLASQLTSISNTFSEMANQ